MMSLGEGVAFHESPEYTFFSPNIHAYVIENPAFSRLFPCIPAFSRVFLLQVMYTLLNLPS